MASPQSVRAQIASGKPDPVYAIIGDDDHEKSALATAFGEMVEDDLRAFNVERLYATDPTVTPRTVADAANTLPMMAPRRVVIVLLAENLFEPRKRRKAADATTDDDDGASSLDALVEYFERPSPTTALVFVFSRAEGGKSAEEIPLARNLKVTKALLQASTLVVCTGLDGGQDPTSWVEGQVKAAGLSADRAAIARLVQAAGGDPVRLRADTQKVLLYAAAAGRFTADDVVSVVAAPERQVEEWALVNAVQRGDVKAALRELDAEFANGDSGIAFKVLGQLGAAVRNPRSRTPYPPKKVPAAVEALFRTDLALKSSGGDPRVLIERLVVELCG
jgi:DNA polymerase-3 subunit delta